MIDGLRPYPAMKPTGLPWLPELPVVWEIHRAKYSFREADDRSTQGNEELLSVSHKTGVTPRSQKNITMFMAESYEGHKVCRPGDIVVNTMWAWMAALGVSRNVGIVSPAYGIYRPRSTSHFEPRYLDYLLRTDAYRAEYLRSSRGVTTSRLRLYPSDFLKIPFVQPPLDEQRLIVRFLDWHGGQTAKLIRAKKKLIALLNEQKQAVIHRAVTRGLDPNVTRKSTGVVWLDDVPENWEVLALSVVSLAIQTGPFGSQLPASLYISGGVPVINPSHIVDGGIQPDKEISVSEDTAEKLSRHRFEADDIVVARRGELGRCAVVGQRESGWVCGTGSIKLRLQTKKLNPNYCVLLFSDPEIRASLKLASVGATMDNLNEGMIGRTRIPLPAYNEQIEILRMVAKVEAHIGALIGTAQREIAFINEFRTRLIADVVTGKLDVRAVAASLPEATGLELVDEPPDYHDLEEAIDTPEDERVAA
jgi:type I restriction enzyme S subunit